MYGFRAMVSRLPPHPFLMVDDRFYGTNVVPVFPLALERISPRMLRDMLRPGTLRMTKGFDCASASLRTCQARMDATALAWKHTSGLHTMAGLCASNGS